MRLYAFCVIFVVALMTLCVSLTNRCSAVEHSRELVVMKGQLLSSVVWSPDGKKIAFLASPDDDKKYKTQASIWVISAEDKHAKPRLLRAVLNRKEREIPFGLFWLDEDRLGWVRRESWSNEVDIPERFRGYVININSGRQELLFKRKINIHQKRSTNFAAGADDLIYDANTGNIILIGGLSTESCAGSQAVHAYSIRSHNMKSIEIPSRFSGELTIGISKADSSAKKKFLLAGSIYVDDEIYGAIWEASSLEQLGHGNAQLLIRNDTDIYWPRPSPNGRYIAWVEWSGKSKDQLVLYDIKLPSNKSKKVLAKCKEMTRISSIERYPALGCTFSWSPDSRKIAYADGEDIKIIDVGSISR
ncbi:MAG: hypothetical protein ACYC27_07200 [Armatimonadota bacterium]